MYNHQIFVYNEVELLYILGWGEEDSWGKNKYTNSQNMVCTVNILCHQP